MTHDHCAACPVAAGSPCVGYCEWGASDDPVKVAHVVAVSHLKAGAPAPAPGPTPGPAIPRGRWPLGISLVSLLARPGDLGIGDTVARVVGPIGGEAFKAWYRRITGQECGCGSRQEALNATYPYPGNPA